jgi:hypothetical protein
MKNIIRVLILTALLSLGVSLKSVAQYPGCDLPLHKQQSTEPDKVDYCPATEVPLDENIIFLITASIAIGLYGIRKKRLLVQ